MTIFSLPTGHFHLFFYKTLLYLEIHITQVEAIYPNFHKNMLIQQYTILPRLYLNSSQDMRALPTGHYSAINFHSIHVIYKKLSLFLILVTSYMDISPLQAVIYLIRCESTRSRSFSGFKSCLKGVTYIWLPTIHFATINIHRFSESSLTFW